MTIEPSAIDDERSMLACRVVRDGRAMTMSWSKSAWFRGLVLGSALCTGACYHARVSAPAVSNLNEPVSVTKVAWVWGLVQGHDEDTTCVCLNNGLKEVTATTNFGYLLLSVVTLGIVVPTELSYVCGKPPIGGKFPDPPSSSQCRDIVVLPVPPSPTATPTAAPTSIPNDADAGVF